MLRVLIDRNAIGRARRTLVVGIKVRISQQTGVIQIDVIVEPVLEQTGLQLAVLGIKDVSKVDVVARFIIQLGAADFDAVGRIMKTLKLELLHLRRSLGTTEGGPEVIVCIDMPELRERCTDG